MAGHGVGIGQQGQIEGLGNCLNGRPEVDAVGAAQVYRKRNPDGQQHIVIEVEREFARGNGRVHAQILRAEQALLFRGDGRKIDIVWRALGGLRVGAGKLKENAAAGSVVGGAVVDVVALCVWIDAEVVVVRAVENGLALGCAWHSANDVGAVVAANAALHMRAQLYRKFNSMEARLAGRIDGLIEIALAGQRQQFLRHVVLNPRGGAQRGRGIALQIALLDSLGVANHLPAITRQIGAVDDEHPNGTAARSFLVFVGPAPVISEGLAFEEFLVVGGRLVDDDQQRSCPSRRLPA